MDLVQLTEHILAATCHLIIIRDNKAISAGSGVFVEGGRLLTAAHVVFRSPGKIYAGDLMIRREKTGSLTRPPLNFQLRTINVDVPEALRTLTPDITCARFPDIPPEVQPLLLAAEVAPRGTEVLIAGYTDEIPLALDLDWTLELMNPDMNTARDYLDALGRHFVRPPMVKRALISAVSTTRMEIPGSSVLLGASYVLDNDLTYGGSGGPVMNLEGELLGVVIRRATTAAHELKIQSAQQGGSVLERIFSGSGLALSHHFVAALPG